MKYMCNLCHLIVDETEYSSDTFYCPKCGIDKTHFTRYVEIEESNKKVFIDIDNPSINRIIEKCINCGICTKTCNNVTGLNKDKNIHECINCGNCLLMCPTGAICPRYDYKKVMNLVDDKEKVLIAFIAPAVKASISECFNCESDEYTYKKLISALRDIGFNYVLDTSFSADVTIVEESKELISRLKTKKNLPMFTSCCPAWVKYVETKYPEFIPNLSTVKSPNAIMGSLIKSYFSEKSHIPKEKIITVGIVPCTAKKYEGNRPELTNDNLKNVDYYLTTTEISMMVKERKINFTDLRYSEFDSLMSTSSKTANNFASTGGVTESILSAISYLNKENLTKETYKIIKDTSSFKELNINIKNINLKVLIIYGINNAKKVLDDLKNRKATYDFIEVMACPMGCIGGAGNKLSNINKLEEIRNNRLNNLTKISNNSIINNCFQNKEVTKLYNTYLNKERITSLLHTTYTKK